jgi:hypothetical protein
VLCRDVVVELAVEHQRTGVEVGTQPLILGRKILIFLLIHFFVDDILLGHAKATTRSLLMDLRSSTRRLNARLKAAVTSSRCCNVCTVEKN